MKSFLQKLPFLGQCIALSFLLCVFAWLSLFTWSIIPISGTQALSALTSPNSNNIAHRIILDLRLPRVLIAGTVGACLAVAGAIMQGLTRNPLASPSVLGVNAGAALGMATVSTVAPWLGVFGTSVAAIIGGAITWSLVMILGTAWRGGNEHGRLVLAGVAISALCAALTKAMIMLYEDQAVGVMTWLAGSVADARWSDWQPLWPMALFGLSAAFLVGPTLNLLNLGEDSARSLGVKLGLVRMICSVLVLILVGAALSAAGAIAFVGLLVPHIARALTGQDYRKILPLTAIMGATLVVLADVVSRAIIFPMETPAGAIIALIGAPFFIYMVRSKTS
jgi:ferric citrate transport system permease protein